VSDEHPAMIAAHSSWDCVQRRAREEWLGLMAKDVTIEDPIGVAPTNPSGEGFHGMAGAEQFWDGNIGRTESIHVETHESFAAGLESAHVLTLTTKFPTGMTTVVHGIFTYTVNEAGKLRALRGFWSLDEMKVEKPAG
jgi:steroid delta-isomerase